MKKSSISILIFSILLICVWVSSNISWGKENWKGILESDAKGYYAYLPAVFIYKDLNFTFFDSIEGKKYFDKNYYYDYRVTANNNKINKYWCGTAICELPFFLIAHSLTHITNHEADGYSKLYPIFINCAGIFYLVFGLYCLDKLMQIYNISVKNRLIIVGLFFFATNLFYYTIVEPGMSHVFSFAWISFFLVQIKNIMIKFNWRNLLFASISIGLIFLIRPINILIIFFVPFLAGSLEGFISFLRVVIKEKIKLFIVLLIVPSIASIQILLYKISCGQFFVDSYPGESFNFLNPHLFDLLFSYKKGLFLYTPFYLVCLFGLIYLFKNSKWEFFTFFIFFVIISYILSSWHNWWYGGSFSSRVFVDYLPIFGLTFGTLLQKSSAKIKNFTLAISVILVLLCQAQIYQYRYNLITWDSMTKEKYWEVFLRLDKIK
ncbi:MAG: hypothetical protein ACK5D5_01035 [Bacteroidota bacterium]|jgi:hypothetical protein